jgi:hypothetical protein
MLGHASAAMTLDVYAGLFDDDLDGVADRMDALARAAAVAPGVAQGTRCRSCGSPREGCKAMNTGPVVGAASGSRTRDLRITRPMFCVPIRP